MSFVRIPFHSRTLQFSFTVRIHRHDSANPQSTALQGVVAGTNGPTATLCLGYRIIWIIATTTRIALRLSSIELWIDNECRKKRWNGYLNQLFASVGEYQHLQRIQMIDSLGGSLPRDEQPTEVVGGSLGKFQMK